MAPFTKPETVLKQAEGLISVGQTPAALQSLTEMFSSKRFRSTPIASLEPVMLRFIELCVDLRKGRTAKEGLMQYKNIAQNTNVASIETVVNQFIHLAMEKVQEAQVKADKAVETQILADVDDLEASETPEHILLGAVSGDQSKDRTDRALVTPWLKFLWESYRSALETLKNNARLENIYQAIALQAFKFCQTHKRKVEFRRLCETLRTHLTNVAKYSYQSHSVNLADPDTLQRFLDTRFAQLNTSVELELWQEAFRSIEDIHNLLTMSKKVPKPSMMVNYYEKLYKIFMTSGSVLYHAAAWSKYYAIVRTAGTKTEIELTKCAGFVLLSALSVPTGSEITEDGEEAKGKHARLITLLSLSKIPSRNSLINDALARNVLKISPKLLNDLYEVLEVDFDPLGLCAKITPILKQLAESEEYANYVPHLRRVVLSRLLSQLSQVYSSITIISLLELIAPLNEGVPEGDPTRFDQENTEAFIMSAAKRAELSVRVHHSTGSLTFVEDVFSGGSATISNTLQPSAGTLVRTRLSTLALCLSTALEAVSVDSKPSSASQLKSVFATAQAEKNALQVRRSIVARRRELLAELVARKQSEERSHQAEVNRRAQEEAQKKKKEDALKEARKRAQDEIDRRRKDENEKILTSLQDRGVLKDVNVSELDTDKLVRLQVEQMDKEKRELHERMRIIAKRMDHLERALRKAELPLLSDDYTRQQADDKVSFEASRQHTLKSAQQAHQEKLATKKRLSRMIGEYHAYTDKMISERDKDYDRRKTEAAKKIAEEKAKRRTATHKKRDEEARQRAEQERIQREEEEEEARLEAERIAEEERRIAEEKAVRAAEEAKKREEQEKSAALRKKREEERAAADEAARKQREREEEAERRRAERRAGTTAKPPSSQQSSSTGTEWRRSAGSRASQDVPVRASVSASGTGGKYIPPSLRNNESSPAPPSPSGGSRPGWRERGERARLGESGKPGGSQPGTPGRHSPALPPEEDGFHTVGRRSMGSGQTYRAPGARSRG